MGCKAPLGLTGELLLDTGPRVAQRDDPVQHRSAWPGVDMVVTEVAGALELVEISRRPLGNCRFDDAPLADVQGVGIEKFPVIPSLLTGRILVVEKPVV